MIMSGLLHLFEREGENDEEKNEAAVGVRKKRRLWADGSDGNGDDICISEDGNADSNADGMWGTPWRTDHPDMGVVFFSLVSP